MVGGTLIEQFTVTNTGPDTAQAVVFNQTLPAGVTLLSATSTQGTADSSGLSVMAALGALAPNQPQTITVKVRPTSAGPFSGAGTVSESTADPDPSNHTAPVAAVVQGAPSQPALSGPTAPVGPGQPVTFTAVVPPSPAAGTPTGSVTFTIDGQPHSVPLADVNGVVEAAFTTEFTTTGTHTVRVNYPGDNAYAAGSASQTLTVNPLATTTRLAAAPNPAAVGATVTLAAAVAPAASSGTAAIAVHAKQTAALPFTGSVTFKDGNVVLATVAVNASGQAVYATTRLAPGAPADGRLQRRPRL